MGILRLAHKAAGRARRRLDHVSTTLANRGSFKLATTCAPPDMQGYFAQVGINYRELANPFHYYEELIAFFSSIGGSIRVVPLADLMAESAGNEPRIAIRHDVDADPVTAVRCARYLARVGIPGSFFLLHTSPYYGTFQQQMFVRSPLMQNWVRELVLAGCEIGLHNDALGVYLHHGLNGAQVVANELAWLRDQGAVVKGTVAHNSGPAYGAENSEIFDQRVLWKRTVRKNGKRLPLGVLSELELGLTYEGTYVRPKLTRDPNLAAAFLEDVGSASTLSESWMRSFLHSNPTLDYLLDFQFWLLGIDKWAITGPNFFLWDANLDCVLAELEKLPKGSRAVLVIHPEYVRGASSPGVRARWDSDE